MRELIRTLIGLNELKAVSPASGAKEIGFVKAQLQQYITDKCHGALIRSRTEKVFESYPTFRSLSDERESSLAKEVIEIQHKGIRYTEAAEIASSFRDHYSALFAESSPFARGHEFSSLIDLLPKLTDDECTLVSGPFTLEEGKAAISDLKTNKTSGPDGLSRELCQKFSALLAPVLLDIFTAAYDHDVLPPTFYLGHAVLIPKTQNEQKLQSVDGYRPISLCNVDNKIFAKLLSRRFQLVITSLVGPYQTCVFSRYSSIQTNTHIARSILECVSASAEKVALIQIDLSKAFDRVSLDFLFAL